MFAGQRWWHGRVVQSHGGSIQLQLVWCLVHWACHVGCIQLSVSGAHRLASSDVHSHALPQRSVSNLAEAYDFADPQTVWNVGGLVYLASHRSHDSHAAHGAIGPQDAHDLHEERENFPQAHWHSRRHIPVVLVAWLGLFQPRPFLQQLFPVFLVANGHHRLFSSPHPPALPSWSSTYPKNILNNQKCIIRPFSEQNIYDILSLIIFEINHGIQNHPTFTQKMLV